MPGKPGWDALDPLKSLTLPPEFYPAALQGVLRRAQREHWERIKIQEVLEALGLAEMAALGARPPGGGKNASAAVSGAVSGPPASPGERWCPRKLHRMVGGNIYTDPRGHTRCRKCRSVNRAVREPTPDPGAPGVAPAPAPKPEPPAPKPKSVAPAPKSKPVVPALKPKPVAPAPEPKPVVPELKPKPPVKERAGDRQWCKRKLHLLLGENLLTDNRGKRECRQCRLWRLRRNRARKSGREFDEELV